MLMMRSKVSVVITAWNSDRYLRQALESVDRQTYRNFELIVVDDGSDGEGAYRICREFQEDAHLEVQYIRQDNGGPSRARNAGLAAARGFYVAFLDADDMLRPEKLSCQVEALEKLPGSYCCVIGCACKFKDTVGTNSKVSCPDNVDGWIDLVGFVKGEVRVEGTPGYYLFRRDALIAIGGYDNALRNNEDFDLLVRLGREYRIKTHKDVVFDQRIRTDSLSVRDPISNLKNRLRFAEKIERNCPDIPSEAIQRKRQRAYFSAARQCLRKKDFRGYLWLINKGHDEGGGPKSLRGWVAYLSARPLRWFAERPVGLGSRRRTR